MSAKPSSEVLKAMNSEVPDSQALGEAARRGDIEVVSRLLQKGDVDPNTSVLIGDCNRREPLVHAVHSGNIDMVSLLLSDPRVDPIRDGYHRAFYDACQMGRCDIVQLFIKDGRIDDDSYRFALRGVAYDSDDVEMIRLLLTQIAPSIWSLIQALTAARERIVTALLDDGRIVFDDDNRRILAEKLEWIATTWPERHELMTQILRQHGVHVAS